MSGEYSTPVRHSLPKSMHNNAKSMHSNVQGFIRIVSHQEEKGGADPDLLQRLVLLSQWMGWPGLTRSTVVQKHWY